ncbi:MAG: hypothetical protein WD772_06855, partial [Pseudohongiellaceae bacterium]
MNKPLLHLNPVSSLFFAAPSGAAPIAAALFALALIGCSPQEQGQSQPLQLSVTAVSNKPYLISGGDALLEISSSS